MFIGTHEVLYLPRKKRKKEKEKETQTLPDEAPPIGKIQQISKITVTFEPVMPFGCPSGFRISKKNCNIVHFMTESSICKHYAVAAA